jgi:hypothetical protein
MSTNNSTSSYNLPSPFEIPSKTRPANIIMPDDWMNNNQHTEVLGDLEEDLKKEELEESMVDDELDMSVVEDTKEDPSKHRYASRQETPCYSPDRRFYSKKEFKAESTNTTIVELTKLVHVLQKEGKSSRLSPLMTSRYSYFTVAILSILILYLSGFRPYCTPSTNFLPCEPCPQDCKCNAFSVIGCEGQSETQHPLAVRDGRVCVRNDTTGDLAYKLSLRTRDILEEKAWYYDCLGGAEKKHVDRNKLHSLLLEENLNENSKLSMQKVNISFISAFEEMVRLMSRYPNVYHFNHLYTTDHFYSYRFESGRFSCWVSPYAVKYVHSSITEFFRVLFRLDDMEAAHASHAEEIQADLGEPITPSQEPVTESSATEEIPQTDVEI